eukprot:TRINITY_DN28357_c0_g1_i6.p2 TRINITY_DN28357_c0_g1~~TRINITY_DN28357_c0_g1_i6.p2  ORF type:complete len:365 (+),score=31.70 TRINITY_DN28357_c0_g1_i6:77-1096(+)
MLNRSTGMPASAIRTVAAKPASPPPTTITRCCCCTVGPPMRGVSRSVAGLRVLLTEVSRASAHFQLRLKSMKPSARPGFPKAGLIGPGRRHPFRAFGRVLGLLDALLLDVGLVLGRALFLDIHVALDGVGLVVVEGQGGEQRGPAGQHQHGTQPGARHAPAALGLGRDRQPPGDGGGPQAVGEVEDEQGHAHHVEHRDGDACEREAFGRSLQRCGERRRREAVAPLGALGHEPIPSPSKRGDVVDDKQDAHVPRDALQRVPPVVLIVVPLQVRLARRGVIHAQDAVKGDRDPEGDLDEQQVRHLLVDPGHFVLEVADATLRDRQALALPTQREAAPGER